MSLFSSASTASPGAVGLARFRLRDAPIGLSSINTASYCKLMFAPALCPVSAKDSSFSVWPVRTRVNRDSALHSNFPKQYAAASAEAKNDAAKNHANLLSSYLTQRVANTPLQRAT